MEIIEIGKANKRTKDEEIVEKLDCISKGLERICEELYDLLGEEGMSNDDALIDITANIKGAEKAISKILDGKSKLPEADRELIESKSDAFLKGLGLERLKKIAKRGEEESNDMDEDPKELFDEED